MTVRPFGLQVCKPTIAAEMCELVKTEDGSSHSYKALKKKRSRDECGTVYG
jgi:hypothetical protein